MKTKTRVDRLAGEPMLNPDHDQKALAWLLGWLAAQTNDNAIAYAEDFLTKLRCAVLAASRGDPRSATNLLEDAGHALILAAEYSEYPNER